ncbi:hypothetical protein FDECE_4234 [Fusarium decemcellulare]|nr:hypothetical protein FDECE_4234 [Fusarium decemcellulare]
MGDPLSVAASIAGLTALADVTFKYVYKYSRAAKDAKTEVQSLAEEINDLASLLRVLGALASDLEAEGDKFDPTLRHHHLDHCRTTLTKVEKRVKKAADRFSKSRWDNIHQQLKWPFSVSETKGLLADLSRHKATINAALAADTMRKLQLCLTKADGLGTQIVAIGEAVRRVEINTLIDVNDHKQSILNYFMTISPQPNLETSIRLRYPMTGLWLTESASFRYWLETSGSKLWLTGIPGAGKTVLAGSVVQEALTRAHASSNTSAAFFFCDYKDSKTWSSVNILGAVSSQLARQKDEAFEILRQYYDELHPARGLAKTPDPDELRARISQMSELFDQTIIVVDGLDECGDSTEDVVDALMQVTDDSDKVSMALFSRDHFNIRIRLDEDFEVIPIVAHTEDIQLYVGAELEKRIQTRQLRLNDMSIKEEIMEALVSRAGGMFRWAVCQLDYLCNCAHDEERRDALGKLPPDLPESYRRLLERVNRCSQSVQTMVKMCLHFIAYAGWRLTILELRQAISTPAVLGATLDSTNTISEEEISDRCSSLIRKSESGNHFEFAHFSVQEFLENEAALSPAGQHGLQKYLISSSARQSVITSQCLRFIQLKNFGKSPRHLEEAQLLVEERDNEYPFYKYAAGEWIQQLTRDGLVGSEVLDAATALFHPSKKPQFQNWAIEFLSEAPHDFDDMPSENPDHQAVGIVLDTSFSPLHMAAALNIPEICTFLLDQGIPANLPFRTVLPIDLAFVSAVAMLGLENEFSEVPPGVSDLEFNEYLLSDRLYKTSYWYTIKQRNLTIDCFISMGAKPSYRRNFIQGLSICSIACLLGAHMGDFTPVIKLLSCNFVPQQAELFCFKESLQSLYGIWSRDGKDAGVIESSTLAILHQLKEMAAYTTEWGQQLGSIVWQWALENHLSYTDNVSLVDSRISMSEEALNTIICSAIGRDDFETLNRCVADERFDKTASYSNEGDTLLHLAVKEGAPKALEVLLLLGCDPGLENKSGDLPIHLCKWYFLKPLHVMKQFGVSLSCPNSQGYTLFHIWARDCAQFDEDSAKFGFPDELEDLNRVFELDVEGSAQALQMKATQGDTPLLLLLKQHTTDKDKGPRLERMALSLIQACSNIPGFWKNHDPMLGTAVNFGSAEVVRRLQDAGVGFEAPLPGTRTPLHLLPITASEENTRWLIDIYADSVGQRVDGELPVDAYITAACKSALPPQSKIIEVLTPPTLIEDEGCSLWNFIGTLPSHFEEDNPRNCSDLMSIVVDTMIRLGSMQVYENQKRQSGLIPLLLGILEARSSTYSVATDTIRNILLLTNYWAVAKQSHIVLTFSKLAAVVDDNFDMIQLLLEHGVDVHVRSNGESLVEIACKADNAIRLCATPDGKEVISSILRSSNGETLNSIVSLDDERRGLLHSLATNQNAIGILWLLGALVRQGVDINSLTQCPLEISALAYHVRKSSFLCARALLLWGADPLAGGNSHSPKAIAAAIETQSTDFLQQLLDHRFQPLDHTFKPSSSLDWEHSMELYRKIDEQPIRLSKANALHCASLNDSLDCLEFLLDKNLVRIEISKSAEGWTPLHVSAWKGSVEAAELLISRGFGVMEKTKRGETPMHMAAKKNHLAIVKLLVENEATQSTDFLGKTPMQYAHEENFDDIVQLLEGVPMDSPEAAQLVHKAPLSHQQLIVLADALADAVHDDDEDECERLIAMGCPIDAPLHGERGCSALVLALQLSNLELAEWLLDHGASAVKSTREKGAHISAIEIAAADPDLNPLLPKLLTSYCAQGGDLVRGDDLPFHAALWDENIEGFEILLQTLEECIGVTADMYRVTPGHAFKAVLNHRSPVGFRSDLNWGPTALHIASHVGSISAASLLAEKGAVMESVALDGSTPLMCAESADMAEHLIKLGASTAAICRLGSFPSMMDLYDTETFREIYPVVFDKVPISLVTGRPYARFPTPSTDVEFTATDVASMHQLGCNLAYEDAGGRSVMHCIICCDDLAGFALNSDCELHRTTPFPWHLTWCDLDEMAFLGSRFRDFQRKLPRDTFCRILNLEPSHGWSPLCRAVSFDLVEIMANCLEMGAQIDFEGCPVGSAVMYASACGSLEVVKFLVRNGASLTYFGREGFRSCFLLAGTEEIKSWLLCGRFTELLSIEGKGRPDTEAEVKPWSGIGRAGVRLYGKREKAPMGSTLDNAKRLWKAREYWKGKIVPIDDEIVQLFAEEIS